MKVTLKTMTFFVFVIRWCGAAPTELAAEWHSAITTPISTAAITIERM